MLLTIMVLLRMLEPSAQCVELYCTAKIAGRLELKAHGKCISLNVKPHFSSRIPKYSKEVCDIC